MRQDQRLRKRFEFTKVQEHGRRYHTPHFIVVILPNGKEHTRLGITVTKKVGHAVTRNRIKRMVREGFRHERERFPDGLDMVFIAKRGAGSLDRVQFQAELRQAAQALTKGHA